MGPFWFNVLVCGATFANRMKLRQHKKTIHGEHGRNATDMPCLNRVLPHRAEKINGVPNDSNAGRSQPEGHPEEEQRVKEKDVQEAMGKVDRGTRTYSTYNGQENKDDVETDISDAVHQNAIADTSLQANHVTQPCPFNRDASTPQLDNYHDHCCTAGLCAETDKDNGKQGGMLGYRTCGRRFRHYRRQTARSDFKCNVCGYSCFKRQDLESHIRRHIGDISFRCRLCDYAAVQSSQLYSHMRKKHPSSLPFTCTVCNRTFGTAKRLRHHCRLHPRASKITSAATARVSHDEVHSPSTKLRSVRANVEQQPKIQGKAPDTKKTEKDTQNQRRHLTRNCSQSPADSGCHLAAKPYKCSVCKYSCFTRSILAEHVRTHTGEKPYTCTLCDYATGHNSAFYVHMRKKHPGTRQFKCTVCCDSFVTPRQLMKHLQVHIDKTISRTNAVITHTAKHRM